MTSRGRLVVPVAVLLAALALTAASVQRIPADSVGLTPDGLVVGGWRLHAPFRRIALTPRRGTIVVDDLGVTTREGSRLDFRLDLSYEFGPRVAPRLLDDVRTSGLRGAVRALGARVLEEASRRADAETLLASPALAEEPLRTALDGAGLLVSHLTFRSPLGDELARRRATEAARSAERRPLAKILVIGWDGADWDTIRPLVAAGRMPHLARFLREGASGDLRSYDPMFSPLLWTTVATGKAPTEHGIADFLVKDAATGARRPITSDFRRCKALWNILSEFDRPSAWIAWWATYPAEEIRGTLVSDYLSAAVMRYGAEGATAQPGVASPAGVLRAASGDLVAAADIRRDEVSRLIPTTAEQYDAARATLTRRPDDTPGGEKPSGTPEDPVAFVMRVLALSRTYNNLAIREVRAGVPFVAVYFEAIDMMGHRFQHALPPKMPIVSDEEFARFREAVPRYYEIQDEMLGALLAAAGADRIVVLLSDHGFMTGADRPEFPPYLKGQPEQWHRAWGIVALHGPRVRAVALAPASIYDIAPTLLFASGLPLADDMPGRVLANAFDDATRRDRPPARVHTYELIGPALHGPGAAPVDPGAMKEMMANLRALGYIGGNETPPAATPGPDRRPVAGETRTQFFFHRNLAVSYIRQGRYEDAERELLIANERQPQGKTYALLSEVRAARGRSLEAAAALEEGWDRAADSMEPESLVWIVELHLLAGDRPGAERAVAARSSHLTPALRAAVDGRLAEASGDRPAAERLYREALEADPLLVHVVQRLHALDVEAGRPLALEPFLVATLESHPKVDAYWDLAGQLALARGDLVDAASRFKKAEDLEPENGLYLGHLASAYAAAGRTKEAREALAWAERFPPREPDAWMALGAAWDRLGEPDRAVDAFQAAKKSGSSGPGADIGAVLALARAGRTAEARKLLAEAASRFPESAAVRQLAARLGG